MSTIEMVKARVEEIVGSSAARSAINAVDVQAGEDHDGDPYLRISLHLMGTEKHLDEMTPKLAKLTSEVRLAVSEIDERYSVVRFPVID